MVKRDNGVHECWLAIERETQGGAYIVWRDGDPERCISVPKALLAIECRFGPKLTGTNWKASPPQMVRADVCFVSGPGFIFDEKGLR